MVQDLAAAVDFRIPEGDQAFGAFRLRVPGGALAECQQGAGHRGGLSRGNIQLPSAVRRCVPDHRPVQVQAFDRGAGGLWSGGMEHAVVDQGAGGTANTRSKGFKGVHVVKGS